jgi:RHS repeat-associated protein
MSLTGAKWGDLVFGIDLHLVMVPTPTGPIPTPLPHAFVGIVFDPGGAAIAAAMRRLSGGGGGGVRINGMIAAPTGTTVRTLTPHVPTPPGAAFAPSDRPANEGMIVSGSKTVSIAGGAGGRMTSLVTSCGYPLNLPTSVCMAVPRGAPVLIGGPTALDGMAAVTQGIRTKWFSGALHKLLNPGKRLSKLICFLTGHPVDVMSGEVLTEALDFELPGPLPLVFERNYASRDRGEGPLGPAWHHPLECAVHETSRGLLVRLPDGRESPHGPLAVDEQTWDPIDRFMLSQSPRGYKLTFWDGLSYQFEPVPGAPVSHPLARMQDRCGNTIGLAYEGGRLTEVTDSVGRRLRFSYARGRLVTVRLWRASDERWLDLCRYEYDSEGRLGAALDPLGHGQRYAYEGGVLVKETNRNGLSFYFAYDWYHPDGMCIRTWGDGEIYDRRITYDEATYITLVEDGRGGKTLYYGNPAGLVDRVVAPMGQETRYEWDPRCYRKTAEIDGLGHRTEWAYDERGNEVLLRDALGQETRTQVSAFNLPVERLDAAGKGWRWEYDRRGNLLRAVDPLGAERRFRHDHRGNLLSVEDARGYVLRCTYTERGELTGLVDRRGGVTRVTLDERGEVTVSVDALGGETRIERDACGRPVAVRRPDGSWLRAAYDPEGNVVLQEDALGNVTRYRYGGMNKLTERIDPEGFSVTCAYDCEEALVGLTNELGEAYRIELDKAGRVVKERGFDGRTRELRYDVADRCIEVVSGQQKRLKLERDALGRVVKQVVPRKPVLGDPLPAGHVHEYAYDASGGIVRAKNDAGEVSFRRDALGRALEERWGGEMIASEYDEEGLRRARRTSLGQETAYTFDAEGDILGVMFGRDPRWMDFSPESLAKGGPVRAPWEAQFARDALGSEVERRMPGEVVSRWARDSVGRPAVHRVSRGEAQVLGTGYRYRSLEQLAGLIDTQRGPTWFSHDGRSYLVAAMGPDGSVEHRAADAVGNIYKSSERGDRVYGAGGRLVSVRLESVRLESVELGSVGLGSAVEVRYEHDADGQIIAKVLPAGGRWSYAWDHAGQLEAVVRPDGQRVTFVYDGLGRRVEKAFGGRVTRYVWDGDVLVHELREGEALITWEFEPGGFALLAKVEGKQRFGAVTDHLGTPLVLFDEAGEVAWRGELDLFGVAQVTVARTICPWRWPGQYEDEETGLYYNRFRYYDPETGRYLSQDPLGLGGGLAAYGYAPDPWMFIDPLGLAFNPIYLANHELAEKMQEFMYRDKRALGGGGTHGLVNRIREQILGKSRPGSIGWLTHETEILRQQDALRRTLLEWQARGLEPPTNAWKLATKFPPTGKERSVPKVCR